MKTENEAGSRPAARREAIQRLLALTVVLGATAVLMAHEGHGVLPPKGASVKGNTVTLSPEARKALDLKTTPVEKRTLERTVLAPASVVLRAEAHAFATALLAGKIEQVTATPGQLVAPGDVVAWIRSPDLQRLQLETVTARLELELAEKKLKSLEDLSREGLGTALDLLAARSRRREKANSMRLAELKLQALGVALATNHELPATDYGLLPVRAPVGGVVAHLEIAPGLVVQPEQHLLEIADPSQVWVRAEMPEAYVRQIAVGQDVHLRLRGAGGGESLTGVIRARQGRIDAKTLAEPVWIEVVNAKAALAPGMAGQVQVVIERVSNALCVPAHAIVRDGIETYVFVQTEPGKYDRTPIITGLASGNRVQVTGGLFAIDTVVTQGQRQLASLFVQGVLRPSPQARKNTGLRIEPVGRQVIAPTAELDAMLEVPPQGRSVVASPLTGKLARLPLTEPREVKQGEPLAGIDSLEFRNLQFDLIQAELAARLQRDSLDAYQKADPEAKGVIPGPLRDEARINLAIAEARRTGVARRLLDMGLSAAEVDSIRGDQRIRDHLLLRSPRAGLAIPRAIVPGQVVPLGSPLFEIQDRSRMWVRGHVPETELGQVRAGQPARVRLTADPAFSADTAVQRLGNLPEGDLRMRNVWAELPATDGFLAENMLARLIIPRDPGEEVLAVPLSSITRDGSSAGVFVYEAKEDRFILRPVKLGRQDDRFVEVRSGLKAGEQVAVTAVADLRRGYGRIK